MIPLTAKEMAEEMERLVLAPGRVTFLEVAEAVIRLIQSRAGVQDDVNPAAEAIQYHNAIGPIDAMYAAFSAMDNNDTALEEWPQRAIDALAFAGWAVVPYALPFEVIGDAKIKGVFETGNPKHGWDCLVAKVRIGPHGPPAAVQQPMTTQGEAVASVIEAARDVAKRAGADREHKLHAALAALTGSQS